MPQTVPFSEQLPAGYSWLDDEPDFDPSVYLALEEPDHIVYLADLGYPPDEIAGKATPVAASSPFRLLSDEGSEQMLHTARRLRTFARRAADRIERTTRGGCYRSRWLRDLCTSPELTAHLSSIYGVDIAPHAMPLHLGHLNFEPTQADTAVDKWHHDTLPLDFVLTVTDPNTVSGGEFEYFHGTKHEAAALSAIGQTPPRDRVVTPTFAGPGFAIALHGDMVVHRAAPLTELSERITMVNGYVSMDRTIDEQSRCRDLIAVDDHNVLWTEWAKFAAWRSVGKLEALIVGLGFTSDRDAVIAQLEAAIADVRQAIDEMRTGEVPAEHYGG